MENWYQIGKRHDWKFKKLAVLCEQQNYRCCYCGIEMNYPCGSRRNNTDASIEHIIPVSFGGKLHYSNVVAACQGCNTMRSSDIEAMEFYEWRIAQGDVGSREIRKRLSQYRRKKNAVAVYSDQTPLNVLGDALGMTPALDRSRAGCGDPVVAPGIVGERWWGSDSWLRRGCRIVLRSLQHALKRWEMVRHVVHPERTDPPELRRQIISRNTIAGSPVDYWCSKFVNTRA